jgi:hypothetical protein
LYTHISQLQKSSAHCRNLVSAQVWRVVVAATSATCIFSFRLGLSLGYGLEFSPCALALERGTLHLLAIRPRVCFQNYSLSRLRCSGVALAYGWVTILLYCLWLNEHTYFSNTIVVLDWVEPEDVMVVNTRNKSYTAKRKFDPPRTSSAPSSSSQSVDTQTVITSSNQGVSSPLPSSKYNILNQLANIKAYATLLDMVFIPKQHKHLKDFMEGKISTIANLFEDSKEEDSTINRIGVNNFRNPVKNPPFYISVKIMDKIAHCCLIDGGSGPTVMSKIIMEELGLSCTNENSRSMLSYNNMQQSTIGEIKDVTLVLCVHPEIRTTLDIQLIDMHVSNYSIILGRDWKALIGGYLSLNGTHLSVTRNRKNIIVLREGIISPYIESVPQPNVNYLEEYLGVYSKVILYLNQLILLMACGTCILMAHVQTKVMEPT